MQTEYICYESGMMLNRPLTEKDLAALAKRFRQEAGINRPKAARKLKVTHTSVFNAEENLGQSLFKLRKRMIEKFSPYKVKGAFYFLSGK
jgi:DNA-binding XRE family transcriptional regulator